MVSRRIKHLIATESGAAAAEMALVTPLLITLMFGSFELGNYFLDNHVVAKAVRDGARYAARQNFSNFTACSGNLGDPAATNVKNLVRTGQVASGGTARLRGWTNASTITVTISCNTTGNGGSAFSGMYTGLAGMGGAAPVVTVTATVPYSSLFQSVGFNSTTLTLNARAQAPVIGI